VSAAGRELKLVYSPLSVPDNKNTLSLEGILCLHDLLGKVLSVVGNLSPHVINQEGLREVVFVVGEGHSLEVEGHHGAGFDIAELEATSRGVHVNVEELGHGGSVLGEVRAVTSLIPLLIVVNNVVCLGGEELSKLLVLENSVKDVDFINGGLSTSVSDTGSGGEGGEGEVDFPDGSLSHHHEGEGGPSEQNLSPSVIRSVESGADLVKVVGGSHAPFPVVVLEDVVAVLELGGVALSLGLKTNNSKVR